MASVSQRAKGAKFAGGTGRGPRLAATAKRIAGDGREVYISSFFPGIPAFDPSNCSALAEFHFEVKHERCDRWRCG